MNALAKSEQLRPGIYEGLSMEEYLAMPAASASTILKIVQRCPRSAWFESWLNPHKPGRTSTAAQSVGTLAHSLLLENSKAKLEVIDPNLYPTKSTGNIPDGWTNADIKAARDRALRAGMIPVFPEVAAAVEAMVAEARAYLATVSEHEPAVHDLFLPGGGKSEVTIVWEEDGCLFRMRPDRISAALNLMGDVKTTKMEAEPDAWGRKSLFGMGYYVAAAFYCRGLEHHTGKLSRYVYLAQEQEPPHLCSLIGLDGAARHLGKARADRGIAIWKDCMKTGVWPGYPNRVAYPAPPRYELQREEEIESAGHEYAPEKLYAGARDTGRAFANEHDPAV